MKYTKPALTFEAQADLLIGRGLIADRDALISKLKAVNYYRLSAYLYTFRKTDDAFFADTTLDKVWQRYTFDRQLRLIVLDAIERVEISVRTLLVNAFALKYGAFGHIEYQNFKNMPKDEHDRFLAQLHDETAKSRERFVQHYYQKYYDENDLPLWMTAEIMSFGILLTFFRHTDKSIQKQISLHYQVHNVVFDSWLQAISATRNICAHHGRLWNREFGVKPIIPNILNGPGWHSPVKVTNDRLFGILTVLFFLLKQVAPTSEWKTRFMNLLAKYPEIPIKQMGFPENWRECPIWQL